MRLTATRQAPGAALRRRRTAFGTAALIGGLGAVALILDGKESVQSAVAGMAVPVTAVEARVVSPPRPVRGTDDRWHVEYDLAITNVFTADAELGSIDVLDERGTRLLRLESDALRAVTTQILSTATTLTVPASATVQTVLDVTVPGGRRLPRRLTHRIVYSFAPDALFHQIIGSRQIDGPSVEVERRKPVVIAPPLEGSGWIAVNACCEPSSHRSFVLAANGRLVTPEVFAIDWIQERGGRVATRDGAANADWYGYGAPIRAATAGTVVAARNDMPEVPPGASVSDNPTLTDTDSLAGNHVVMRIRRGVYALYGHMIPGSVRVKVGDRVRRGALLGLLGNSGNTSAPHLHFGLTDGPSPLDSDSLPFVIDRFIYGGVAEPTGALEVRLIGAPRAVRRVHPLSSTIAEFTPAGGRG